MKKLTAILLVLGATQFGVQAQSDTWVQLDNVNGAPKSSCIGFVLDGEGYIGLGLDEYFERKQLYSYDVAADDWDGEEAMGNAPGSGLERAAAVSFAIGDSAFVGLGSSTGNAYFLDFWVYDSNTDTWSQVANFEGTARRHAVGFSINDLGYVGTGVDINGDYRNDFWEYDPVLNDWTQLNDFGGTPRQAAVGYSSGGFGYIGTGDDGVPRSDFWEYDPTLDQWTQKPDCPGAARAGAVGFGFYPQLFIATGYDINLDYTNDVWEFNIDSNYWIQRGNFGGVQRTKAVAFVIGDLAYLGTGYNNTYLDDFWSYEKTFICPNDTAYQTQTICDNSSYTWIDGNTYLVGDGSGPFNYSIAGGASFGCDSISSLTINWEPVGSSTSTIESCESSGYSWVDGNTYYPADGTGPWYHTMVNGSANGCDSLLTLYINWSITVDITVVNDGTTLTSNASLANTFQWIDCDNANAVIPGATGQFYTPTVTGNFAVIVSNGSCQDTSACENIIVLSLDENVIFNQVSIYPNPVSSVINLDLGDLIDVNIKIYTIAGKLVYEERGISTHSHSINFDIYSTGVYSLEVEFEGLRKHYKLIKK